MYSSSSNFIFFQYRLIIYYSVEVANLIEVMAIIQADTLINHGIDSERIVQFKDELKRELNDEKENEGYRESG